MSSPTTLVAAHDQDMRLKLVLEAARRAGIDLTLDALNVIARSPKSLWARLRNAMDLADYDGKIAAELRLVNGKIVEQGTRIQPAWWSLSAPKGGA